MQTLEPAREPDLLDWILAKRFIRTLIAIVILIRCLDTVYDTGKSMVQGFRDGYAAYTPPR